MIPAESTQKRAKRIPLLAGVDAGATFLARCHQIRDKIAGAP